MTVTEYEVMVLQQETKDWMCTHLASRYRARIIGLNDFDKLSFNEIADYLEKYGLNISLKDIM